MNKVQSLRQHLLASPLKLQGDEVLLSATDISVHSAVSDCNRHFEWRYTADLLLLNFSGKADVLTFVLLQWLDQHQPNRNPTAPAFSGDIDVLNGRTADVHLLIPLSETVKVETLPTGVALHHWDEKGVLVERLNAPEWTLFANDEAVAQWTT